MPIAPSGSTPYGRAIERIRAERRRLRRIELNLPFVAEDPGDRETRLAVEARRQARARAPLTM